MHFISMSNVLSIRHTVSLDYIADISVNFVTLPLGCFGPCSVTVLSSVFVHPPIWLYCLLFIILGNVTVNGSDVWNLYIKINGPPTVDDYDFNCTLPLSDTERLSLVQGMPLVSHNVCISEKYFDIKGKKTVNQNARNLAKFFRIDCVINTVFQ